jgi:type I restriction enzyme S subunit
MTTELTAREAPASYVVDAQRARPGYKQTEVGVIPADWDLFELNELIESARGIRYGIVQPGKYDPSGRYMIRGQDYSESKGWANPSDIFRVGDQIEARYKNARVQVGDLIMTIVGYCGHVQMVPNWLDGANLTQTTARIAIDRRKAIPTFCMYILQSPFGKSQVATFIKGAAQPGLNCGDVEKFIIPLPPNKAEQEAIADALSDADALIAALEQLIAKKRHLKQGAMQELLTGKKRLPGFGGEWEVKRLGSVLKFQVGFPFSSLFFNEDGQGARLVKNRDLKNDGQVFHYSGKFDQEFLVQNGDVLVGMDGDFLPCQWMKGEALLNQRVGRIVPLSGLNSVFAYYFLIEPLKEIENATSSTTVKHLSHGGIEGIEKPLPSLEEQTAIATNLSDMDAEIAALETQLTKARGLKQGMMQELLTGRIRLV